LHWWAEECLMHVFYSILEMWYRVHIVHHVLDGGLQWMGSGCRGRVQWQLPKLGPRITRSMEYAVELFVKNCTLFVVETHCETVIAEFFGRDEG